MTIVDTHAHIISSDPKRFPYAPLTGSVPRWPVERLIDADRLVANMDHAGVDHAVLVQYSTFHGYDNSYVLDTAQRHPDRFVAVVTLDGRAAAAPQQLTRSVQCGAAGLRLRAPDRQSGLNWLTCDALWRRVVELNIPVCVHFMVHDQAAGVTRLGEMLRRFPEVTVVLDHVGNPPWAEGPPDYGLQPVMRLADHTGLYIKFATINLDRLNAADLGPRPVLQRLIHAFGAQRIMWGSDAPNTPGDYADMLARVRAALTDTASPDPDWILGGTALRVYPQLEEPKTHARLSLAER
jgi:predicted TIM-barrel fold metal-dependent hydrolase